MKKLFYIALLACTAASATPPEWANNDKVRPGVTPNISPVISPDIRNTNLNAQDQRQAQGQLQGQAQFATGGNSSATGGNASATGGTSSASVQTSATGGAGGSATSTSAGGNASNNGVSTTVNNVSTSPSDIKVRSTGAAPDILTTPTAPCRIAVGVSGGFVGGALGFGTSVEDEGCTLRENARLLHNFGEKAAALKLMCNDAKVAAVLSICPPPAPAPQVEVSVKP